MQNPNETRSANMADAAHAGTAESVVVGNIERQPAFRQLVEQRSRFTWALVIAILAIYFCLIGVVAFQPQWMRVPLADGFALTIAWPIGAGVIVVVWLLMGAYVKRANSAFESMKDSILAEAQR